MVAFLYGHCSNSTWPPLVYHSLTHRKVHKRVVRNREKKENKEKKEKKKKKNKVNPK